MLETGQLEYGQGPCFHPSVPVGQRVRFGSFSTVFLRLWGWALGRSEGGDGGAGTGTGWFIKGISVKAGFREISGKFRR